MDTVMLKISGISKEYKYGQIGGTTLVEEFSRLNAKIRHKEDPTKKVGVKNYNTGEKFFALKDVSFEVNKGERIGIIGRNGAGKSTLLKLISRITAPTEGTIDIYGRIASLLEVGTGFNAELTGRENIYINGAILGMTRREIDAKIEDIIEFSECREFIDTPVKRYSSGMLVKLAFAVAANLDAEILIMDEVLAVGDVAFQKKCLDKMNQVSRDEGRTILYVSHNMSTVRQLCDRCIVLDGGEILFQGETEEAIEKYLGSSFSELPVKVDLSNHVRKYQSYGEKAKLTTFEFINKEQAFFTEGEVATFEISYEARDAGLGLGLQLVVENEAGAAIGMAQTYGNFKDATACGGRETFSLDLSPLAPGRYRLGVALYTDPGDHRCWTYDRVSGAVVFQVTEDPGKALKWSKNIYGDIKLGEILHIDK